MLWEAVFSFNSLINHIMSIYWVLDSVLITTDIKQQNRTKYIFPHGAYILIGKIDD